MRRLKAENINRVVVRGTNWVGDAVMTVPALRELRSVLPGAHITLVTRSWARGLFDDSDFIDEILVYDRTGLSSLHNQIKQWRKHRFDLALLFQNSFEAALLALLARVPHRLGYATDGRRALLTDAVRLPEWCDTKHEIFYYLNLVEHLETLFDQPHSALKRELDTSIGVSITRKSEGLELLGLTGVGNVHPLVAFCPGSINSRAKRWPVERYAALGDRLTRELGAKVLLIGSEDELRISLEVSCLMQQKPVMLTGRTELSQLVAILSVVDLLVTNDTGPAHIAPAMGTPTIVIFGPTNPLTTRPYSSTAEIVRHPPDCAPCMLRDCPIDHRCMTAISPDEVFERAQVLLARKEIAAETHQSHSAA